MKATTEELKKEREAKEKEERKEREEGGART